MCFQTRDGPSDSGAASKPIEPAPNEPDLPQPEGASIGLQASGRHVEMAQTRRFGSGAAVLFDVFDGILNRPDLLRVLVGDVDFERFLERQDELDQTKRISTQIVDEHGFGLDIRLVDVQLFLDDSLYFGRNIATCRHFLPPTDCLST
jgi:hypothetical protein